MESCLEDSKLDLAVTIWTQVGINGGGGYLGSRYPGLGLSVVESLSNCEQLSCCESH